MKPSPRFKCARATATTVATGRNAGAFAVNVAVFAGDLEAGCAVAAKARAVPCGAESAKATAAKRVGRARHVIAIHRPQAHRSDPWLKSSKSRPAGRSTDAARPVLFPVSTRR